MLARKPSWRKGKRATAVRAWRPMVEIRHQRNPCIHRRKVHLVGFRPSTVADHSFSRCSLPILPREYDYELIASQGHRSWCQSKAHGLCDFLLLINNNVGLSPTVFEIWRERNSMFSRTLPSFDAPAQGESVRISGWNLSRVNYIVGTAVWWKLHNPINRFMTDPSIWQTQTDKYANSRFVVAYLQFLWCIICLKLMALQLYIQAFLRLQSSSRGRVNLLLVLATALPMLEVCTDGHGHRLTTSCRPTQPWRHTQWLDCGILIRIKIIKFVPLDVRF